MPMGSNIFSMPVASTALLLSFAFGLTSAMPWTGPQETKVYRAVDFSPKPTGSPVEPVRLAKRDQWMPVNVCGWIAGRPESVARCGSGSSCVHDTIHNVVGCCATAGACTEGVYTTCLDSGKEGWKSTQGLINNGILSCKPSSTCFQNTFAGNYKQFSCGESKLGVDIQTTYEGQASDMKLQQVYMGVTFSPMSKALYTTVPLNGPSTPTPEAGKEPTSTEAPGSGSSSDKEETTGYIAGGTIGGVALAAIAIAGIILFLRRRKLRKGQRVGGFVSLSHDEKPPTAGPFKRMTRYSAHDFGPISRRSTAQEVAYMSPTEDGTTYISPLTGHPNESHAPYNIPHERDQRLAAQTDADLLAASPLTASTYNGAFPSSIYDTATAVPISRLNVRAPSQSPSPQLTGEEQRQPLVGISIDEFGPTWNNSTGSGSTGYGGLGHQRIYSGDMPEGTDMGLVSTMRRAASQIVSGNSRTVDHNMRSESFRHSKADSQPHVNDFGDSIWDSQPMNPPTLHLSEPESNGSLGFNLNAGGGSTSSSSARTLVPEDGEGKEVFTGEKPLMEQMMEAFNRATRVGGEPSVVVKKDVYQLVHEGMGASGSEVQGGGGEGVNRGASNAGLLRKPVGGTILHKRGASEGGMLI